MHYKRIAPLFLALTVSCVPLSQYVNSATLINPGDESRYTMEVKQDYNMYNRVDIQAEIDGLDKSDAKQWYLEYRRITQFYSPYYPIDVEKSIHYYANDNQFDLICRVVQAEIGGGDFNAKCNVASTIINRWRMYAPRTWESVIYEKDQYTPIWDGRYKKVTVDDETRLAVEYVFEIGDTTNGAIYFHSGRSRWHEHCDKIELVKVDQWHKFYRLK